MILNDYFNSIFTDCKENIKLLENCFRILTSIALDKKNSQQVSNIHAFRLILHLGATSKNPWIVKGAIESLQNILNFNWENVICFYDQGIDYLNLILERNVIETENSIESFNETSEIFPVLDETLRYISFLLGNAWEKNMDIIKIYSAVVLQHGGKIEKERLQKLVLSIDWDF